MCHFSAGASIVAGTDPVALATLLWATPHDVAVQTQGVTRASTLCRFRGECRSDTGGAAGLVEAVCASMARHPDVSTLQHAGCEALHGLMKWGDGARDNQRRAHRAGAAALLIHALGTCCGDSEPAALSAMQALAALTEDVYSGCMPRLLAANGRSVLTDTLEKYHHPRSDVHREGTVVLERLPKHDNNRGFAGRANRF